MSRLTVYGQDCGLLTFCTPTAFELQFTCKTGRSKLSMGNFTCSCRYLSGTCTPSEQYYALPRLQIIVTNSSETSAFGHFERYEALELILPQTSSTTSAVEGVRDFLRCRSKVFVAKNFTRGDDNSWKSCRKPAASDFHYLNIEGCEEISYQC